MKRSLNYHLATRRPCHQAASHTFIPMVTLLGLIMFAGCLRPEPPAPEPQRPNVAPEQALQAEEALVLDPSQIKPMYPEMLAIDLPAVVRTALASNLEIQQARQAVQASLGRYESTVGAAFPAIVPTALFEHVEGRVRATPGRLVGVGFNTFQPSIAVQWVINPGRVIYDILASKKRLKAAGHQERAVILETLRVSVVQYYAIVLAQAEVAAENQGVAEAQELLRITRLGVQTGTGVRADELRAEASLAARQQDLIKAMTLFYDASVNLAVTLHLPSSVTLVPRIEALPPTQLVREDLDIDEMLAIAVLFRPDLRGVRELLEAVAADEGATWWGGFGPQFEASYQYSGLMGSANDIVDPEGIPGNLTINPGSPNGSFSSNSFVNGLIKEGIARGSKRLGGRGDESFGLKDQQRARVGVGWRLSLSAFGDLKTAKAMHEQARIEVESRLDLVKAQVVSAAQAGRANRDLIDLARQQVTAAAEALRLIQANLRAGTMTTLDVLQAEDAATQARLRLAEAVVTYNQSQINLLAALGLLDEKTILPDDAEG